MQLFFIFFPAILLSIASPQTAIADDRWQSLDSIRQAVHEFVLDQLQSEEDLEVKVARLDRRLKLPQCTRTLSVFWPPGGRRTANTSVGVSCEGEQFWKIYVQATIAVFQNVAVLAQPVIKGETLEKSMIRWEKRDVSRLGKSYIRNVHNVLGYRIKRASNADKLLTPQMLEAPLLVRRGQRVTIVARHSAVQVRMFGEAMADGIKGSIIKVKNISSQRIVEGVVGGRGVIEVINAGH